MSAGREGGLYSVLAGLSAVNDRAIEIATFYLCAHITMQHPTLCACRTRIVSADLKKPIQKTFLTSFADSALLAKNTPVQSLRLYRIIGGFFKRAAAEKE